jgi:radical SAM protein with 4Fe4S-binding SPASM domain
LVPYVLDLAAYIKERGGECLLLTNGTLIDTAEKAAQIAELFGMVKISLDTLDEDISKTLRGTGIVEKARRAFDLLSAQKCNVQMQAAITSKTYQNLDAFAAAFNNQVHFQPLYRDMGRARSKEDLSISGVQYFNALKSNGIFINLGGFHQNIHGYRNNPYKRCALAKEELSVDSDGNVFPCHMLHFESLACGNLNKEKIADIYRNSPVLKEMRTVNVDTVPKCKVCVFRNFCGGACRARVDVIKDGIKGNDDFCTFEQESILDALLYSYG